MHDVLKRAAGLSAAKRDLLLRQLTKTPGGSRLVAALIAKLGGMTTGEMEAEAELDPSVDPQAAAPACVDESDSILLTGATGFVGAFLLEELLRRTRATIYCLVRAADADAAQRRIFDNAKSYLINLEETAAARVVPVVGDLSRPLLGLTPARFDVLAHEVKAIHHCGALVRWTYPYKALREPNVLGTHEVLRLATRARLKPVHFISTVGVFASPDSRSEPVLESEDLANSGALYVGYAQSKWVAERLVARAAERGLPVTIFRPNVAADSRTGAFNAHDHVWLMMRGCVQLGSAPRLDFRVSGAPVDYVSRAVVYLSGRPESLRRTIHLGNQNVITWEELCGWMRAYGYRLRAASLEEWSGELAAAVRESKGNVLQGFLPFLTESTLDKARLPRFDCAGTLRGLAGTGITCPPIDSRLLETYFSNLTGGGHLAPPHA
jgi:myxalamid-type nonribosomal peptide synthetase MxaA